MRTFSSLTKLVILLTLTWATVGRAETPCATTLQSLSEKYDIQRTFLSLWSTPTGRTRVEHLFNNGLFAAVPELGAQFLQHIATLLQSKPQITDNELFHDLQTFLFPEGANSLFAQARKDNIDERVGRRVTQLLPLVSGAPKSYLDVGAGDGAIAGSLGEKLKLTKNEVFATDVAKYDGVDQRVTWLVTQDHSIPLPSDSVELITILMVLHHVEYLGDLLDETYRVLKSGGQLLVRETNAVDDETKLFNFVLDSMFYKVFRMDDIGVPIPVNYKSGKDWQALFNAHGFIVKEVREVEPTNPFTPVYLILTKK